MTKKIWLVILFLIVSFLVVSRFLYLDRFPIGMSHDELEYILSAKTYFLTGADLSNSRFPASIFQTKTEGLISFLPAILLSPYYGLVHLDQFNARLPYVFINLITAWVLFLLVKKLFDNKNLAWISLIIFLVNPWSFYLSRTASDTAFALLFYLLGIFFILDSSKKKLFLSFLFFVLGFFSYHGAKIILIPLILICLFYRCFCSKPKLNIKSALVFLFGILFVFGFYFFGSRFFTESINKNRSQDILFLNQNLITPLVDSERKTSLQSPIRDIFSNKVTVSLRVLFQKYLTVFSPEVLFISGDTRGTYRFGQHGLFFIIDFVFIFVGLINLFKKYPQKTVFLILLVLISPLTTAISTVGTSIINRSFLLLPILIMLISFGFLTIYKFVNLKISKFWSFLILFLIISLSFINFLYFYFLQFPIIGQENYFFSQRVIANYVIKNNWQNMVIVDPEYQSAFFESIFYDKKDQNLILKDLLNNQKFVYKNTIFTSVCPKNFDIKTTYIIKNSISNCDIPKNNFKTINEEQFGGYLYTIINDHFCDSYEYSNWKKLRSVKDYLLEDMNNFDFCKTWVNKP